MGQLCFKGDAIHDAQDPEGERQGQLGVIFRHFDEDRDGLWCYEELCRWAEVMKGERTSTQAYDSLCRQLNAPAQGLSLGHVALAYGSSKLLEQHFKKLIGMNVQLSPPRHLFLIPGMKVRVHSLMRDTFLNNTEACVISLLPSQDAAVVRTERGPLVVPFYNLARHTRVSTQRTKQAIFIIQSPQHRAAEEKLRDVLTTCGVNTFQCICAEQLTKSSILTTLSETLYEAQGCQVFIAFLTETQEEWRPVDHMDVGPLRMAEVYDRTVLSCPVGGEVFILETGRADAPLLHLRHTTDTHSERWLCMDAGGLGTGGDGADDGCTPHTLWLTSAERPELAGRYTKTNDLLHGWPVWENNGKFLYSDAKGHWKACGTPEDMAQGLGGLKSEDRHPKKGEVVRVYGDKLPGLVQSWSYALHGSWARCAATTVMTVPPKVTCVSTSGTNVMETVRIFATSLQLSKTLQDFCKHSKMLCAKMVISSMHAPELTAPFDLFEREAPRQVLDIPVERSPSRVSEPDGFADTTPTELPTELREARTPQHSAPRMSAMEADAALFSLLRKSVSPVFRHQEEFAQPSQHPQDAQHDIFNALEAPPHAPPLNIMTPTLSDMLDSPQPDTVSPPALSHTSEPLEASCSMTATTLPSTRVPFASHASHASFATQNTSKAKGSIASTVVSEADGYVADSSVSVSMSVGAPVAAARTKAKQMYLENAALSSELDKGLSERMLTANALCEENAALEALLSRMALAEETAKRRAPPPIHAFSYDVY